MGCIPPDGRDLGHAMSSDTPREGALEVVAWRCATCLKSYEDSVRARTFSCGYCTGLLFPLVRLTDANAAIAAAEARGREAGLQDALHAFNAAGFRLSDVVLARLKGGK